MRSLAAAVAIGAATGAAAGEMVMIARRTYSILGISPFASICIPTNLCCSLYLARLVINCSYIMSYSLPLPPLSLSLSFYSPPLSQYPQTRSASVLCCSVLFLFFLVCAFF